MNTASESGLYGNAGQANYAAAKAGIASMTIVMARELERIGVRVNAICPVARTRLTETVAGDFMNAKEGEFDRFAPENISAVVGWLASDLVRRRHRSGRQGDGRPGAARARLAADHRVDRREAVDDRRRSTPRPAVCSPRPTRASRRSCPTSATTSPRRAEGGPSAARGPSGRLTPVRTSRPNLRGMTIAIPTTDLALDDIALGDIEQWMRPDREGIFAKLRAERPISFHEEPVPPPDVRFPQGPGFWALTRYADVMQVSRDPDTFHSAPSSTSATSRRDRRVARVDDQHGRAEAHEAAPDRQPRLHAAPGRADRRLRARAGTEIVDRVVELRRRVRLRERDRGRAPLQIICDMMGIPATRRKHIFELTNTILGVGDPEYVQTIEQLMAAGMELFQYGLALARGPARQPRGRHHDHAHAGRGRRRERRHKLTPGELGSFFLLLVVAGNETTRNAISHGMRALTEHPDQRAALDGRSRERVAHRGRGDRPLGDAGHPLPPHRDRRHRRRRPGRSRPARRS